MPFFTPKPPITKDEFDWLIACFAWLRTVLDDRGVTPQFVLPGHPMLDSARTANELFDAVKILAGMEQWPCRLEKVDDDFDPGDIRIQQEGNSACGTFSVEDGEAMIRYSDSMLQKPDALTATFAHELCHYLLCNAGDPPGGPDLIEHSTDCAAAYIGFGVFLANGAREFAQFNDGEWSGWRASTTGYLSEQALVTATAIFAQLHGHDLAGAEIALKPYLQKDLRKAVKAVRHAHPDVSQSLDGVNLLDWNYE